MAEFSAKTPAARTAPGPAQRLNYILQRLAELQLERERLVKERNEIRAKVAAARAKAGKV